MEDLKHWTTYLRQRSEHVQNCWYCQMILGQFPFGPPDCLEYMLLTGKVNMAKKKWI